MVYVPADLTIWSSGLSEQYWTMHVYDTTDSIATVRAANYITDAEARGMEVGDLVFVRVWQTSIRSGTLTAWQIMVVLSVGTSGADLSDGLAIPVTNT